ncbi:MAG: hypothetical protein GY861_18795 [bacterium]|nr:hypothetical protein [bacterium]
MTKPDYKSLRFHLDSINETAFDTAYGIDGQFRDALFTLINRAEKLETAYELLQDIAPSMLPPGLIKRRREVLKDLKDD